MSDEKKISDSKNTAVDGFFDSLIEDFNLEQSSEAPEIAQKDEDTRPKGMRDFSQFFNDATASGSGFQSTIDAAPEVLADNEKTQVVDFTASSTEKSDDEKEIITAPVTDEDGMIVIFDEEAGIDATSPYAAENESQSDAAISETEKSVDLPQNESAPNDFSADDNIDDEPVESIAAAINGSDTEKRSFIQKVIPWKNDTIAEIIRKIVFLASISIFAVAGVMLISTLTQSQEIQEEMHDIQEKVTTTVATSVNSAGEIVTVPPTSEERESHAESVINDFIELSENVKGFIEIPSCDIYLPVVQGTDNNYYLTHTYDDRKNKAGSIFIDYRCTVSEEYTSPNIVLYGHNQEDGTMFGNLKNFKNNVDFYKRNPIFSFNTDYGVNDYVIYGYFVTNVHESQDSKGEVFHYHDYIETLKTESTFDWYMDQVAQRNQIIPPVDVVYGDQLIVLSTCSNEYSDSRFVVFGRKLREGESQSSFDFSQARLNPNAKQIDWSAILSENSVTESSSEETTTVPTQTTTETTPIETTTSETETTTVYTTAASITMNGTTISFVPQYVNGTTASVYSETTTETTVPEETTQTSKTGLSLATQISQSH